MTVHMVMIFLDKTPKAQATKLNIEKLDYFKIKNLCASKKYNQQNKKETYRMAEHYLQILYLIKGYIQHIQRTPTTQLQRTNSSIKKWAKALNRHFSKEDRQMANKQIKRCLTSLIMREMQIKTIMR